MSKRRVAGEIVWKRENAGFVGVRSLVQIQPEDGDEGKPCFGLNGCVDKQCREWATVWEVDETGKPTGGMACHVSECEMEDR